MRHVFIILGCLALLGCSGSPREKLARELREARQMLTKRHCQEARQILERLGDSHMGNPEYLTLYASSLACSGNYNEIRFFSDNMERLSGVDNANLLYALSLFYNATDRADSAEYAALDQAMRVILYSGNGGGTRHADRLARFGDKATDSLNTQLFYMSLTQLGRYIRHYGNVAQGSDGPVKGAGDQGNSCFIDYTQSVSQALLAMLSATNPCDATDKGHPAMKANVAGRVEVMCEGIVLFNTILELISAITFSGENTTELQDLQSIDNSVCDTVLPNEPACLVNSHSVCEALPLEDIERLMAIYFELGTDGP